MHRTSGRMVAMDLAERYQKHLDKVSRSFALCIARLEGPLRAYVGLTYLLCRVLDTIEDSPWRKPQDQIQGFNAFEGSVAGLKFSASPLPELEKISAAEKDLIFEAPELFNDFVSLPESQRRPIQDLLLGMCRGMRHFVESKTQGQLRLKSLSEVNQYCFFVAGIVGETLARIVSGVESNIPLNKDLIRDAHHFGLFLQKVNLLKDQIEDEKDGRYLIPSRKQVYESLKRNAEGAWSYVEQIPNSRLDYKIFCLWSLFLGLKTLPLLRYDATLINKLTREDTRLLFVNLESIAADNKQLKSFFEKLIVDAQFANDTQSTLHLAHPSDWINDCYKGLLEKSDLASLGIVPA